MIPEGHKVAYECRNGHINTRHDSTLDGDFRNGKRPACSDCGARLTRKLVPLYECEECGNVWAYTGDADRPTCSTCRGKRVKPVAEADT